MIRILLLIYVFFTIQSALADPVVCSRAQIRVADQKVIHQFSQEAWRFLKIKMGLYPKWTGPYEASLIETCRSAKATADAAGEGSAIFIGLDSDLYQNLARSTNSWVSHTGLLFKGNGDWVVIESKAPHGPSTPTPICDFIRRSAGYRFAITRVRAGLSTSQIHSLRDLAAKESRHEYDFSFDISNKKSQFCSKLTYSAYRVIGLEFGKIQSLEQILDEYQGPEQDRQSLGCFWMAWTGAAKIVSKHHLSIFDWNQLTITPASQYQQSLAGLADPRVPFVLVYDSQLRE